MAASSSGKGLVTGYAGVGVHPIRAIENQRAFNGVAIRNELDDIIVVGTPGDHEGDDRQ